MKRIFFTITLTILLLTSSIYAASPVSLTSFYESYSHLSVIQNIQSHNQFDGNVATFLMDETNLVSEKLAVMNALINHNQNNNSAVTYSMFISRIHKANFENLDLNLLSGNELLCLGYLKLIDNLGNPAEALPVLKMASEKSPNSKAIQMIFALVNAQSLINSGNSCEAWKSFETVSTNTKLNNDLDGQIAGPLMNQMQIYADACK